MRGDVALQQAVSHAGASDAQIGDKCGARPDLTFEMALLILSETGPRCRIGSALGSNTKSTSLVCTPKVLVMAHCCARAPGCAGVMRAVMGCMLPTCMQACVAVHATWSACPAAECARCSRDQTDTYTQHGCRLAQSLRALTHGMGRAGSTMSGMSAAEAGRCTVHQARRRQQVTANGHAYSNTKH